MYIVKNTLVDYRTILKRELELRKERNGSYSLRSFARFLEISPTALSQVLNKNRNLAKSSVDKIIKKLDLPDEEARAILARDRDSFRDEDYHLLSETDFDQLDWWHFAILSLLDTDKHGHKAAWFAERLNIEEAIAEKALQTLLKMKLIEDVAGRLRGLQPRIRVSGELSEGRRRAYAKSLASKAIDELTGASSAGVISSIMLPFSEKELARAEKFIHNFVNRFNEIFATSASTSVFGLTIMFNKFAGDAKKAKK